MVIPSWLVKHFRKENFSCPNCRIDFDIEGVYALGIKISESTKNTREMLFCNYKCNGCKKSISWEIFDLSLSEFAIAIIDDAEEQKEEDTVNTDKKSKVSKSKSKISLDEKKQAINMLDESNNWVDWLNKIGIPAEDYTKPPDNNIGKNFHIDDGESEQNDSC